MIPSHPAHEQCLENYPAESKAEDILEDRLGSPGAAEDAGQHSAREDAQAIARYAVHRRPQRLPPTRRNVTLMQSGERLAATEHIEEGADYSSVSARASIASAPWLEPAPPEVAVRTFDVVSKERAKGADLTGLKPLPRESIR